MNTREELDKYWADKRKRLKIVGFESRIKHEECQISSLKAAKELATERGELEFVGTLDYDINERLGYIKQFKAQIILTETGATLIDRSW